MFAACEKCSRPSLALEEKCLRPMKDVRSLLRNVCGLKNGAEEKEKIINQKLERKQLNDYNLQRNEQ
jgi:hypothetical protein